MAANSQTGTWEIVNAGLQRRRDDAREFPNLPGWGSLTPAYKGQVTKTPVIPQPAAWGITSESSGRSYTYLGTGLTTTFTVFGLPPVITG